MTLKYPAGTNGSDGDDGQTITSVSNKWCNNTYT